MAITLQDIVINWTIFSPLEKELLEKAYMHHDYDNISRVVNMDSREKEMEVQKLLNSLRPVETNFVSEVRREMNERESKGEVLLDTKEKEAYWQKRLDDEAAAWKTRQQDEHTKMESAFIKAQNEEASIKPIENKTTNNESSLLSDLKGLTDNAKAKLSTHGIITQEQFFALTWKQARDIVGILIASRFKDKLTKE